MATVRGGSKLKEAVAQIARQLGNAETQLRVGFLENARYPDGKRVAMIAAIHNYGKWPFFSNMIADKASSWPTAVAANLKATNYDVDTTLRLVGEGIRGQLQKEIIDTVAPPNAPSTIARKGFDKPLIETSHMLNSVDYEIKHP